MGQFDLAIGIGEKPGFCALENAEFAALKTRRVFPLLDAVATGFDSDHADGVVLEERVEQTDRVAPSPNAGDEEIWKPFLAFQDLASRLHSDDPVEIPDHHGKRMCSESGTENIMGRPHIRDPVAQRLIDRFLEGPLSGHYAPDLCSEQAHPGDVEGLAFHVDLAHVNHAFETEPRRHGGRRHAVLAGAGFGDDTRFAEPLREKDLAEGVVDLVGPGVEKILPLQVNLGSTQGFGRIAPRSRVASAGRNNP